MKSIVSFLSKIKNKKLLVVFPHPDDESVMSGGLILRARELGFWITVLTLTEGGRGKIHVSGKGRSVSEIRRGEMTAAMHWLGVADWVQWKFDDGRLRQTYQWRNRLCKFIRDTDPGLVVTYDLSGVTSHPDHISQSLEVLKVFKKEKNFNLLWVSFEPFLYKRMVDDRAVKYIQKPEYELNLTLKESLNKWLAVFSHKSQNLGVYVGRPWWRLVFTRKREWYSEAKTDKKYRYKYSRFRL